MDNTVHTHEQSKPDLEDSILQEHGTLPTCFGDIAMLSFTASSRSDFYIGSLELLAKAANAIYASLHIRFTSEEIDHNWHHPCTDPKFWQGASWDALTECLAEEKAFAKMYRAKDQDLSVAALSLPLYDPTERASGAIVLLVPCEKAEAEATLRGLLESAEFISGAMSGFQESNNEPQQSESSPGSGKILQNAAKHESWHELAFSLVNRFKTKSGASQVALGRVCGKKIKVVTISGFDEVKARNPGVVAIQHAMEECLDRKEPIIFQADTDWQGDNHNLDYRLHRAWHESTAGSAIASIPLFTDERCEFIICLRRNRETPFDQAEVNSYKELVEPYAAALLLVAKATRNVFGYSKDTASSAFSSFVAPGSYGLKLIAAMVLAFGIWFSMGNLSYQVSVPCTIAALDSRSLAAAETAVLAEVLVKAGEEVEKGQLLCSFENTELRLEQNRLRSELAAAKLQLRTAQAESIAAEINISQISVDRWQALLDINQRKLDQTEVRSPIAGKILSEELNLRTGEIISQGETLFKLSPANQWELVLEIPETDISQIEVGLSGEFVTYARPEDSFAINIKQIEPSATADGARSSVSYTSTARTSDLPDYIRPGMEGVATIEVGERKVWWVAMHRMIDYFRLSIWL